MGSTNNGWVADHLIWGNGDRTFEIFLEPTCPFSAKAFGKLDALVETAGADRISVQIWLQSQPWHLFSGIICRAIIAASTDENGKEDAKKLMAAVFSRREAFEFDDHRAGPNLDTTPNQLIANMEKASGLVLADRFQYSGLETEVKRHTKYARQNGIHVSPTFMIDGLIDPDLSSGDSVDQWADRIFNS
ncbi:MAG: DsbA family protein [Rhizobiaceae bacterium]